MIAFLNSSNGNGGAQTTGTLLFGTRMFLSTRFLVGRSYRQPSERLESSVADIQRARAAVSVVFLVIVFDILSIFISDTIKQ